eukprot:4639575-Prymnesium_polylepis.1
MAADTAASCPQPIRSSTWDTQTAVDLGAAEATSVAAKVVTEAQAAEEGRAAGVARSMEVRAEAEAEAAVAAAAVAEAKFLERLAKFLEPLAAPL